MQISLSNFGWVSGTYCGCSITLATLTSWPPLPLWEEPARTLKTPPGDLRNDTDVQANENNSRHVRMRAMRRRQHRGDIQYGASADLAVRFQFQGDLEGDLLDGDRLAADYSLVRRKGCWKSWL